MVRDTRAGLQATVLPVVHDRSRETLERLCVATETVLERDGLGGATVPAIAEEAGMSVGVVYRRFADKDALLRAVYERFFAQRLSADAAALESSRWTGQGARAVVEALVAEMVHAYVQRRALFAALVQYAETHGDPDVRARAEALRRESFRGIGELLLLRAKEIGHPEPAAAIEFALLMLGLALRGIVLGDRQTAYEFTRSEDRLSDELTRMTLNYLWIR
jgi:AcrR family transcriptional regulator